MIHLSQHSQANYSIQPIDSCAAACTLRWRQRKLVVDCADETPPLLPSPQDQQWLTNCLQRSPVALVKLDLAMGEIGLESWATACHQAKKPAYLRLSSTPNMPQKLRPWNWQLKRIVDWLAAAILLLLLSPLMLCLAALISVFSPGPIFFEQWRVGERGKLFKIIKFRTMAVGAEHLHHQVMGTQTGLHKLKHDPRVTPLGYWMRKYSLDELPQLFNVLRGEMSLVGPRPWALYDAVRISPDLRLRLNALPGITGAWQVQGRSTLIDLNIVNCGDLTYLNSWSIRQDFKFLLMTIPKVLSGFGAY
ncbi:MAG: UDP-phosphate galactose phosphotransferase [Leptolyngbya sp.]|nr:MAG: UDP-phosphate galactose phosphotransferase [Leptolyngbya sp.]